MVQEINSRTTSQRKYPQNDFNNVVVNRFLVRVGLYTHSCLSVGVRCPVVGDVLRFKKCYWSTRINLVILLGLSLVRIRVLSDHPRVCPE